MPRIGEVKRNELEAFWRAHLQGWRNSTLNQREYCEAHGLPLKRFGNWRAKFRHEDPRLTGKLLWRRGGAPDTSASTSTREIPRTTWIPSGRSADRGRRRDFSVADKKRILAEAAREGATVHGVAKRYGIAPSVVFRWRRDLADARSTGPSPPIFAEVKLSEAPAGEAVMAMSAPPVVVERSAPGIEVELRGGRRVRFDRETDPETIRTLVVLLEGAGS